jgi:GNAT superfamily N-acetyltransferase
MIEINRTTSSSNTFKKLIIELDQELNEQYGEEQEFYDSFNKIENSKTVVTVKINNKPAGCGCFKAFTNKDVEIKRMFVTKEFRGLGISKNILSELENWAKEFGYKYAVLETGIKQLAAIGLYTKMGYVQIPNYGVYEGVETSVCMKKRL